ncbi:hypothetical protein J2A69_26535 [Burkholderia pseudomallei]|uniref:hypothetical protein n=1 Tax=Burkholderia pseudomallei TaxID=28450 RepID=UPI001A958EE4|nr:hypothetical protein [Burkholderia pseudomallei]QSY06043.1 hypothetical protein J1906_26530 [Burkholderia pseudomallei]QSY13824.1 hypothetical protein J2A69_26535 [Burkholderia pseudomallei]QTB64455.1 hypothetical protein J3D99_11760 [Burkholderia pseudomallei]
MSLRVALLFYFLLFAAISRAQISNQTEMFKALQTTERNAFSKTPKGTRPNENAADIILQKVGAGSLHTGIVNSNSTDKSGVTVTVAADTIQSPPVPASVSVPATEPPDLVVEIDGNHPPTGWCHFKFRAKGRASDPLSKNREGVPGTCNDTASTISVPFGAGGRICEDDGLGKNGNDGWGKCRDYGPGLNQYVGDDMNDIGSSFWAWDDQMVFYMTSDSDEAPDDFVIGITYDFQNNSGPTDGFGVSLLKANDGYYYKTYRMPLPVWCEHPDVWESTRNGDATWSDSVQGGVMTLRLKVKARSGMFAKFQSNNWVGVGIRCKP